MLKRDTEKAGGDIGGVVSDIQERKSLLGDLNPSEGLAKRERERDSVDVLD